jgi:hypothetical protein
MILRKSGNVNAANSVLFSGKERERSLYHSWLRWLEATFESEVIGYWIFPFRILYWLVLLILVGALVLMGSPAGREKGVLWVIAASAQRVLPIIQLNKEFDEFFDDPDRTRVRSWQVGFFCIFAVLGWLLGLILIGLISGAVPKVHGE